MTFTLPKLLKIAFTLLFLVFLGACKSTKTIAGGAVDASLSSKKIIQNHYQNQLDFNTLSGKVRIAYTNGDDAQSVAVSLRIKKDEVIWISSPLGVVKVLITPERVSFYNRSENEYFDADFSYLSSILGTTVDFAMMQNLLLGNAILDLREQKFSSAIASGAYTLKPKKNNPLYKILFQLEPKVVLQSLLISRGVARLDYCYMLWTECSSVLSHRFVGTILLGFSFKGGTKEHDEETCSID